MEDNYEYIDLSYLREASKDRVFLRRILSVFGQEYTELQEELLRMFKEENYPALEDSLHKAKSSVLMTTIPGARKRIIEIEGLVKKRENRDLQETSLHEFIKYCNLAMKEVNHAAENV
jgi:hypothetical protein